MRILHKFVLLVAVTISVSLFASPHSSAFTGHGAGTSGSPYRIANCTQLQEMNNDLDAYYVLVSNIDCDGVAFVHIGDHLGTKFTGTLDGKNHRITNLTPDDYGLFGSMQSAVVKNLKLEGGSVSGSWIGSLAAYAASSEIDNIHSNMTITSSGAYSGGLVGWLAGPSYIADSSFTGTLYSGSSYNGGLVGQMSSFTTVLYKSYAAATMTVGGPYNGGLVGAHFAGTIDESYSNSTVDIGLFNYFGGITGVSESLITDSFAVNTLSNGTTNTGGVVGLNSFGAYSNIFYDMYRANTPKCYGVNDTFNCTNINSGNTQPNYFKNSTTNGPLSTWDFTDVWQVNANNYPTLKKATLFESPTVPNLGDANGDSIDDSFQPHVGSVSDTSGKFSTVTVPSGSGCTLDAPTSTSTSSIPSDTGFNSLVNLTGFTLYCPTTGATVPVTIIYDKVYDTSNAVLRYYNPVSAAYSTVAGATFSTATIGGVQKTTVTYNLTDGGVYDQDGSVNGIIIDPVALATAPKTSASASAPNTGIAPANTQPAIIAASVFALFATFTIKRRLHEEK